MVHLQNKALSTVAASFLEFLLNEGQNYLPMEQINANVKAAQKGEWKN